MSHLNELNAETQRTQRRQKRKYLLLISSSFSLRSSSASSVSLRSLFLQFFRKILRELSDLRHRHADDVRLPRVSGGVVVMVLLGLVKRFQRFVRCRDRAGKGFGVGQLLDVRLGDAPLVIVRVKDRGAVLRADVVALAIQLRGV